MQKDFQGMPEEDQVLVMRGECDGLLDLSGFEVNAQDMVEEKMCLRVRVSGGTGRTRQLTYACYLTEHDEREIHPSCSLVLNTDDDTLVHQDG